MKKKSAISVTHDATRAEAIVRTLEQRGFPKKDISILLVSHDESHEKPAASSELKTDTTTGATVGAGAGGVLGGALAFLAGAGAIAAPGVGNVVGVGALFVALNTANAGAALGGIAGALVGLGLPETQAKGFEDLARSGDLLISVQVETDDELRRVREILSTCHAEHIWISGDAQIAK
jgi:hypothetical protein